MPMENLHVLLARARKAYLEGQFAAARADLFEAGSKGADDPAILHLSGLVEWKSGHPEPARRALERAAQLAPEQPRLGIDLADLLSDMGEYQGALDCYERVLAVAPGYEAAYKRALLLQRLGRLDEALAEVDRLAAGAPQLALLHEARGSLLSALGRIPEAADALDSALALQPARASALSSRAWIALQRGEPSAVDLHTRALRQQPGTPELILGLSAALEAEDAPRGRDLLAQCVRANPGWVAGHEQLTKMRAEAGEIQDLDRSYHEALAQQPDDRALHASHWVILSRAGRHADALSAIDRIRSRVDEDEKLASIAASIAAEAGDRGCADRLFALLGDRPEILAVRAWHALRGGDPELARTLLERVVREDPRNIAGWADLELTWRLLGDRRQEWLSGQPALYREIDLDVDLEGLARLSELLRGLHRGRAHPIGQSLRGGTQTRGRLFWREEPEIAHLREAVDRALRAHVAGLPPEDAAHPLLRHRNGRFAIEGSWSVRLSGGGFHVSHIHPEGVLSSACYISLPAGIGNHRTREGWLELGRPPAELGVGLEPLAVVEPRPGRLVLFPSYLYHGTRHFAEGERLTVAFDVAAR
jgi:tetratricopeptide (TPR) repeat protein